MYNNSVFLAVFYFIIHIKIMRDKHIITLTEFLSVEEVFGNAVHTAEDEIYVFALNRCFKATLIPPFVVLILLGLADIHPHIKVGGEYTRP